MIRASPKIKNNVPNSNKSNTILEINGKNIVVILHKKLELIIMQAKNIKNYRKRSRLL